jgi:DNA-binding transcriptional regulator YhcF (GntR family)
MKRKFVMKPHIPKYIKVKEAILGDIRSGVLNPGDRLPIRDELSKKFAVTRTTIEKAMNELTCSGVLEASRRLGTFVSKKTMMKRVAVIVNLEKSSYLLNCPYDDHAQIFRVLMCQQGDLKFEYFDSERVWADFKSIIDFDHVVWILPDYDDIERSRIFGDKLLVINRYPKSMNFISTDHRRATRDVTQYLLHKAPENSKLFYLTPNVKNFVSEERLQGFIEACERAELFYRVCSLDYDYEKALNTLNELSLDEKRPVVMVSASRNFTGPTLRNLYSRNFTLYKDFFYSDFDNENSLINTGTQIVSVVQDYQRMGKEILNVLNREVQQPIRTYLPHKIITIKEARG